MLVQNYYKILICNIYYILITIINKKQGGNLWKGLKGKREGEMI